MRGYLLLHECPDDEAARCAIVCLVLGHGLTTCFYGQGDGNALIFQDDPAVFTFSVHGEGNFPARKQTSDIDIPLPDGTSDDVYLRCIPAFSHSSTELLQSQLCRRSDHQSITWMGSIPCGAWKSYSEAA